jgi:hypothetical protein
MQIHATDAHQDFKADDKGFLFYEDVERFHYSSFTGRYRLMIGERYLG